MGITAFLDVNVVLIYAVAFCISMWLLMLVKYFTSGYNKLFTHQYLMLELQSNYFNNMDLYINNFFHRFLSLIWWKLLWCVPNNPIQIIFIVVLKFLQIKICESLKIYILLCFLHFATSILKLMKVTAICFSFMLLSLMINNQYKYNDAVIRNFMRTLLFFMACH